MTNSRLQDKSKRANCASELCNDFDIKLLRFSPLASATAATSVHQGVTHMVSLDLSCRSVRSGIAVSKLGLQEADQKCEDRRQGHQAG